MEREILVEIKYALRDARRNSLSRFITQLLPVLEGEGYTMEDLINALADYASDSDLNSVAIHLERAAEQAGK